MRLHVESASQNFVAFALGSPWAVGFLLALLGLALLLGLDSRSFRCQALEPCKDAAIVLLTFATLRQNYETPRRCLIFTMKSKPWK